MANIHINKEHFASLIHLIAYGPLRARNTQSERGRASEKESSMTNGPEKNENENEMTKRTGAMFLLCDEMLRNGKENNKIKNSSIVSM